MNVFVFIKKYLTVNNIILLLILLVAAILRFHKLTKQSLWYDELQTMLDADPKLSWSQLFYTLKTGDYVHPPLYFIIERVLFSIFGYTDAVARTLSAIGGVAGIWAIFLLGREIKNERLGLIAAAIMSVNFFAICFSQEARMYSVLCLFTTLSYLYFLKTCKYLKTVDAVLFVIATTCVIYTHYFGFLVVFSQVVIAMFFLFQEKKKKGRFFFTFLIAELIIAASYLPWISRLQFAGNVSSFWVAPIKPDFFVDYFNEYFGDVPFLSWTITGFFIVYLIKLFTKLNGFRDLKSNPVNLSFIFIIFSLLISFGIPYIRSVMVIPMLTPRYTIVVLPSIIIAFAYGMEATPNNILRTSLLAGFMFLSIYQLVYVKKYYQKIIKAQYREIAAYITSNNQKHTIINQTTSLQLGYYLEKNNFKGQLLGGNSADTIDSILKKSSKKFDADTFWLTGIFIDQRLSAQEQKKLDSSYLVILDSNFYQGWVQMYVRMKNILSINYTFFDSSKTHNIGELVSAIWSDNITSKPIALKKGKYTAVVVSKGSSVKGIFPHNNLYINGNKIGDFYSNATFQNHIFSFYQDRDTSVKVKVDMDNDVVIAKEDRNTFVRNVYIFSAGN